MMAARVKPKAPIAEPFISGTEIGALHRVSRRTVANWAERGEFARYRVLPSGSVEVPVVEYLAWLKRHEIAVAD